MQRMLDIAADQGGSSIQTAPWPKPLDADEQTFFGLLPEDEEAANDKFEVVTLGRGLKSAFNLPNNQKVRYVLKPAQELAPSDVEVLQMLLQQPLDILLKTRYPAFVGCRSKNPDKGLGGRLLIA